MYSNTSKIVLAVIVAAIIVGGGIYWWQQSKSAEVSSGKYENSKYGFTLNFPQNWGEIKEEVENASLGSKVDYHNFLLTSMVDPQRYIKIQVLKNEDVDAPFVVDNPQILITSDSIYSYYYSGAGDSAGKPGMEDQKYFDIQKEVKEVSKTFALTLNIETNNAIISGSNDDSQIRTKIFTNTSGDYSVNYPADWSQGVNGAPDPLLIEKVYFFRSPAEQSKGFDTVNITKFSSKGASYEELLEQNPDYIIEESKGMTYVLTYSNKNFPEETRKIFELISDSFQETFATMAEYVKVAIGMEPVSAPTGLIQAKSGDSPIDVKLPKGSAPMYVYTTQEIWNNSGMNDVVMFYLKTETPAFILEDPNAQKQEFWHGPFYGKLKSLVQ